jgi:hypothetical protein
MRALPPIPFRWLVAIMWIGVGGCQAAGSSKDLGSTGKRPLEGAPAAGSPEGGAGGAPGQAGSGGSAAQHVTADDGLLCLDDRCTRPNDAGAPAEPGAREQCSIALPYEDELGYPILTSLAYGNALATDAAGNLYFAGTYTASLDLGDGPNEVLLTPSVFIAKYDAACKLLWSRRFNVDGHSVCFNAIAVGPNGQLVAGGWLLGSVMFDQQHVQIGPDGFVGTLLVGFDANDGTAQWAQASGSEFDGSGLYQVAFDHAGDIVIGGWAAAYVTIGGHPQANAQSGALIGKVSSTGEYRFAQITVGSESYARSAISPTGTIAVSSLGRENVVSYGGEVLLDVPGAWHRYVALLDPSGVLLWSRDLDVDRPELTTDIGVGSIRFDSTGNLLAEVGDYVLPSSGITVPDRISKLDAQGAVLWTRDASPPGYQNDPFSRGSFALDSLDNIIQTDLIHNTTDSGGDAGIRAENKEPSDFVVQKLSPDGALLWQHVLDTDVFEMAWGLAIGPDDSIWVGHGEDADADPHSGTLRITKLAP